MCKKGKKKDKNLTLTPTLYGIVVLITLVRFLCRLFVLRVDIMTPLSTYMYVDFSAIMVTNSW